MEIGALGDAGNHSVSPLSSASKLVVETPFIKERRRGPLICFADESFFIFWTLRDLGEGLRAQPDAKKIK